MREETQEMEERTRNRRRTEEDVVQDGDTKCDERIDTCCIVVGRCSRYSRVYRTMKKRCTRMAAVTANSREAVIGVSFTECEKSVPKVVATEKL